MPRQQLAAHPTCGVRRLRTSLPRCMPGRPLARLRATPRGLALSGDRCVGRRPADAAPGRPRRRDRAGVRGGHGPRAQHLGGRCGGRRRAARGRSGRATTVLAGDVGHRDRRCRPAGRLPAGGLPGRPCVLRPLLHPGRPPHHRGPTVGSGVCRGGECGGGVLRLDAAEADRVRRDDAGPVGRFRRPDRRRDRRRAGWPGSSAGRTGRACRRAWTPSSRPPSGVDSTSSTTSSRSGAASPRTCTTSSRTPGRSWRRRATGRGTGSTETLRRPSTRSGSSARRHGPRSATCARSSPSCATRASHRAPPATPSRRSCSSACVRRACACASTRSGSATSRRCSP